jgi:hypothetical protein
MKVIYKSIIGEIFQKPSGECRLYCGDLSLRREEEILEKLEDLAKVIEKCNGTFDKALIVDFDCLDLEEVKTLIEVN